MALRHAWICGSPSQLSCRLWMPVVSPAPASASTAPNHTVSQQIRRLEETLGRALLHRTGKRATPTEEGERLLSYARRILCAGRGSPRRCCAAGERRRRTARDSRGLCRQSPDAAAVEVCPVTAGTQARRPLRSERQAAQRSRTRRARSRAHEDAMPAEPARSLAGRRIFTG